MAIHRLPSKWVHLRSVFAVIPHSSLAARVKLIIKVQRLPKRQASLACRATNPETTIYNKSLDCNSVLVLAPCNPEILSSDDTKIFGLLHQVEIWWCKSKHTCQLLSIHATAIHDLLWHLNHQICNNKYLQGTECYILSLLTLRKILNWQSTLKVSL